MQNSEIREKIKFWRSQIKEWNKNYSSGLAPFGNYKITEDGVIHLSDCLVLYEFMFNEEGELPFKFHSANSVFIRGGNAMKSFKNFPNIIHNNANNAPYVFASRGVWPIYGIKTLEDVPKHINGNANFYEFKNLKSFSNAHKHFDYLNSIIMPSNYKGPLLWVFLIKGFDRILDTTAHTTIINSHLMGDRDILDCQEELISNGYNQYAKI